jgi:sarcosine/dimethylglycine N-methyltransferase
MSDVATHYAAGGPVDKVRGALDAMFGARPVTPEQIAALEDFHTAGRMATARLGALLAPSDRDLVLDAGSGVGGPARYLARTFGCRVVGVDLTPEFVEIANMLNARLGVSEGVDFRVGDVTALELADSSVDHAWTQHVAMNIADRDGFYREIRRVLRPGGRFAIFDVIDGNGADLLLPVPWATQATHSHLVTRDEQVALLERAGFRVDIVEDPTTEMLEMMKSMGPPPGSGAPGLTPALLIDDVATKGQRYMENMAEGRTALVIVVCTAT